MRIRRTATAVAFAIALAGAAACAPKQPSAPAGAPPAPTNTNTSAPVVPTKSEASAQADEARGRELYAANCASCHLASGKGEPHHKRDGIPDFTSAGWQAHQDDDEIATAIRKGKGKIMPAFGSRLSDDDVKALVAYVRGFPNRPAPTGTDDDSHEHGEHPHR